MSQLKMLVSKTIQEANYEPFKIEVEYTRELGDGNPEKALEKIYKSLTSFVEAKILERVIGDTPQVPKKEEKVKMMEEPNERFEEGEDDEE